MNTKTNESVLQLVEQIKKMNAKDRQLVLKELYKMEQKEFIEQALQESLKEAENEEVYPHDSVMGEMREKYGL